MSNAVHKKILHIYFSVAGFKLWNGLHIELRNCKNYFHFKKMHKHLCLIVIKGIFYSEMCINMFTVLAFGIFMH